MALLTMIRKTKEKKGKGRKVFKEREKHQTKVFIFFEIVQKKLWDTTKSTK